MNSQHGGNSNPPRSPSGNTELSDLIYGLVNHYQYDHPDVDQTHECRYAIEAIEELQALIDQTATNRCIEARIEELEAVLYGISIDRATLTVEIKDRIAELKTQLDRISHDL